MSRVTIAWKHRRFLWKYRRPLWAIWKHRHGVLLAAGAGIGFLGARAVQRALGRSEG